MIRFIVITLVVCRGSVDGLLDLIPEAITVYKNPDFYKNLKYEDKTGYKYNSNIPEGTEENYKYPGETKKPNPPAPPGFEISYDSSPEFQHEPRDIHVETTHKPPRKKGPYSPLTHKEYDSTSKPTKSKPEEDDSDEDSKQESKETDSSSKEEPRSLVSEFNDDIEEEFKAYHEPILLARPNFDPYEYSGFASNTYNRPYPYNRTKPVSYESWKYYTYPKIHANEHLKSDSKIYSEEPSNSFEDESPSQYKYDYDFDDDNKSEYFDSYESKNEGADTKHIYKKLLKPKKAFSLNVQSHPKFKSIKFKLKKKKLHGALGNADWFDQYPFNF